LAISDTKLVFSLEVKLGDVKVYSFWPESTGALVPEPGKAISGTARTGDDIWSEEEREESPDLR
jgi:hypothetical protein